MQADRPDLSRGLLEIGVKFAELIGAAVIVEMVENKDDLDLAIAVGAQFVQGWYFGKPIDLRDKVASKAKYSGGELTTAPSNNPGSLNTSVLFEGLDLSKKRPRRRS